MGDNQKHVKNFFGRYLYQSNFANPYKKQIKKSVFLALFQEIVKKIIFFGPARYP